MLENGWPYFKFLESSVDSNKLSMTVKGVLLAIVPVILTLSPAFGWKITLQDFVSVADGLTGFFKALQSTIVAVTSLLSAGWIVVGGIRKILVLMNFYHPSN